MSSGLDLGDWVSLLGSFAIVLFLLLVTLFVLKRISNHGINNYGNQRIKIINSIAIGGRQRIVLIRVAKRDVLLGVTIQQITVLDSWPAREEDEDSRVLEDGSTGMPLDVGFRQILEKMQKVVLPNKRSSRDK